MCKSVFFPFQSLLNPHNTSPIALFHRTIILELEETLVFNLSILQVSKRVYKVQCDFCKAT